jgi:hypothetical protein
MTFIFTFLGILGQLNKIFKRKMEIENNENNGGVAQENRVYVLTDANFE